MRTFEGVRVIDFTQAIAGPFATFQLALMGAEVIKIEQPRRGDDTREWGPPWMADADGTPTREASYFQSANRGKQSVAIDICPSVVSVIDSFLRNSVPNRRRL